MNALRNTALSLALIGAAAATPALAHPRLLRAAPAQSSIASNVRNISLTFSERLIAPLSGFDMVMTRTPGAPNAASSRAAKVNGIKSLLARDGRTLNATLARPLPAGSYDVNWHAVSADTHRVTGKVSFTVR